MTTKATGTDQDWELGSGLPNDVDLWIIRAQFGASEEYAAAIEGSGAEPLQILLSFANPEGEPAGRQGYSVGAGWIPDDQGQVISHPTRTQIVRTSRYGTLISRVMKDLGVDMKKYGTPFKAATWVGLGFHWMLDKLPTVSGETRDVLLPTEFLGDEPPFEIAGGEPTAEKIEVPEELLARLRELASTLPAVQFRRQAISIPEVVGNDALMADIMDRGDAGFWARSQS